MTRPAKKKNRIARAPKVVRAAIVDVRAHSARPLAKMRRPSIVKLATGEVAPLVVALQTLARRGRKRSRSVPHSATPASPPPANGQPVSEQQFNGAIVNGNPANDEPPANGPISRLVQQDRELVEQCLSGTPSAWTQMYAKFHGSLLASIRAFLGKAGQDFHLIDEISARVWYALVRNDFELMGKFDVARNCRFSTFLSVLAKTETRLLLRSERRRKVRELVASKPEIENPEDNVLSDDEFLATLSPAERSFFSDVLLSSYATKGEADYTQENLWQLRHRVRRKLEQFLE